MATNPSSNANSSEGGRSVGKILLLVLGSIGALLALALLVAGGVLLWAHATQRDDDSYFTTAEKPFSTTSYALTSESVDLGIDGPDWLFESGRLGTVRISASTDDPAKAVFVGIAPERDVTDYLAGVEHDEVADIEIDPFSVDYRRRSGASQPEPPAEQPFWDASASGMGTQTVTWPVEEGSWSVVVMNADGSRGIDVEASIGAKVSLVLWLAVGLLAGGALILVGSGALIFFGARTRLPATAAAGPGEVAASHPAEAAGGWTYPVALQGTLDPGLSRWLWLVKWLLAIPHYFVLVFLWIAFLVLTVVAGFAILFTERYPRGIFDFNVGVLRWTWRVSFYSYSALATDRYPPFTLAPAPDYPATLEVSYPERLSRGLVLVKWWLLAIPHYIVVGIVAGGWWWGGWWWGGGSGWDWGSWGGGLIGILVLFAAVALLVTSRYPRGIFDLVMGLNRWTYRVAAYAALMRDEYPPFRLDQGATERSGESATS